MRPVHVFLTLVFIGLIVLAAWFWLNREGAPTEVDIAMDPRQQDVDVPDVASPDLVPVPDVDPTATAAPDVRDLFSSDDCRWLTRHIPDADVAYKPGVDVHGKPVVPADLNGSYDFELPKTITASVSRRLLRHPNLRQESSLAEIEIDLETGAVLINGKGLDTADQDGLVAFCRDQN